MAQIFLIAASADVPCVRTIADGLRTRGYTAWKLPAHIHPGAASYPAALERGIRGSVAVVLLWSATAALDEWVERMVLYAQQLKKLIVTVARDETPLPLTVVDAPGLRADNCGEVSSNLSIMLPPPEQDDLLLALLAHDYIREQKKGIAEAATLIARGERREELLALLEDMAHNSLIESVAQEARSALDKLAGHGTSPIAAESRHIFRVRCSKGHVSFFDKRVVCCDDGKITRTGTQKAGKDLDELLLRCSTPGCDETMVVRVDCQGYV
jgi:hypothetical protein